MAELTFLFILQIVFDRVSQEIAGARNGLIWNSAPGALFSLPQFSDTWSQYPFYAEAIGSEVGPNFTAVIYSHPATTNISPNANTPLIRLLKSLGKSRHISRVRTHKYSSLNMKKLPDMVISPSNLHYTCLFYVLKVHLK